MSRSDTTWLPLESNPEVLNKYMYKLGVNEKWNIVDVLGLDKEILEMVPKPVKSVILLFPCSEAYEKFRTEQDASLKSNPPTYPDDLFYTKQLIHNACGTIAIVHSVLNAKEVCAELDKSGVLSRYFEKTKSLPAEERGKVLEADTAFTEAHQELAQQGQTGVPSIDDKVNHHFIAFVNKDGDLYELDGSKSFPIKHGKTSSDTLLEDAAEVCKTFMARDPDEVRFTVLALTATESN